MFRPARPSAFVNLIGLTLQFVIETFSRSPGLLVVFFCVMLRRLIALLLALKESKVDTLRPGITRLLLAFESHYEVQGRRR